MVLITSDVMISNASSPLLGSYALAKEGMITGTHVLFRHPPSTGCHIPPSTGAPPRARVS